MAVHADLRKLRTSWTKYNIVQVMDAVYDAESIEKFKNGEVTGDLPILRSFLGISSLEDPIPDYWLEIQNFPQVKKLFALLALIFTHGEVITEFADYYARGDMKGEFEAETNIKRSTNIRSALVESGAASPVYRRAERVPYDLTPIFQVAEVGKLFKKVLLERVARISSGPFSEAEFYEICLSNNFHKALSLTKKQFRTWLEGDTESENHLIKRVTIANFFSISEAELNFGDAKEIYFLGENGDGKSLILMAIYLAFNGSFIAEKTDLERTGKVVELIRNSSGSKLLGVDDRNKEYGSRANLFLQNLFAYGTHRGRYSTDKPEEYGFMSLFDSEQTLTNPVSWLKNQMLLELEKRLDNVNMIGEVKNLPISFPTDLLQGMFYDLLERSVEIKVDARNVYFIEKGVELSFDQLSEGYKSILIFVSDLLYRLSINLQDGDDPRNSKGVVMVDEIDLHLHPKWQRVIIKKMRAFFPNIQFIFTTHSPTIIQGASEDAILYRVYRNKTDRRTRVSDPYFRKDLDHLMINTVLTSPLFGLDDSRMDPADNSADTSDTYLVYRINKKIEEELEKQKKAGKTFIADEEIDQLIQRILIEESGKK